MKLKQLYNQKTNRCECMYVCTCVGMYVCISICVDVCVHTCSYTCVCVVCSVLVYVPCVSLLLFVHINNNNITYMIPAEN